MKQVLDTVTDPTLSGDAFTIQHDDVRLTVESNATKQEAMNAELYGKVISSTTLNGTVLTITMSDATTVTVDLASLIPIGIGTDDQTVTDFSLTGNSLSITVEGGNTATVDLSSLVTEGSGDDLGNAVSTDVAALFTGVGDYLKSDGTRGNPGTVEDTELLILAKLAKFHPQGTSITSNIIASSGSIDFATQTGLNFVAGAEVKAFDTNNNGNWMYGTITYYVSDVLTIDVGESSGSGTISDWTIVSFNKFATV